nr:histidine kinase [uncultured Carboxylicivirga sp.]
MRTLIFILFFAFFVLDVYSTEIPQLNFQIGKSYKVSTVSYSDSSNTHQMLGYEKSIYTITPIAFEVEQQYYKLEIVLDYYKYAKQNNHYLKGWIEEQAYETGFPCKYTSAITNLNRNKIKMYVEVSKSGKVLSIDLSDYNNCRTKEGLKLELYNWDEGIIKGKLDDLFFKSPTPVNASSWEGDNVNYTLVNEDSNCVQLKANYVSQEQYRKDLVNTLYIDKETGLIREKRYNYLYTLPSNKKEPTCYLIMNHQRYIPEISESFTVAQNKDFEPDSIDIKKTNTIICAEVDSLSLGSMLIYFSTSDGAYQLQSENKLRMELSLDSQQGPYPVYMIWKSSPKDPLFEVLNFTVLPGDSLFIKKDLFERKSRLKVNGIGASNVEWHIKNNNKLSDLRMTSTGSYAKRIKDEIIEDKYRLAPDFLVYNLIQAEYLPYLRSDNKELNSTDNITLSNNLGSNVPIYMGFVDHYMHERVIEDIRKTTFNIPAKADRLLGQYELAKLVYNEPLCGYYRYRLATRILHSDWEIGDQLSKRFIEEYKGSSLEEQLEHEYEWVRNTAIGMMAPDLKLPDTKGKIVRLSDFRGKVVALRFWNMSYELSNNQKFKERSEAPFLDLKDIVEINVIIADKEKYYEVLKSSDIRKDEVVLWADPAVENKEMAIWRSNGNRSFVLDKYGTIQWSAFVLASIAMGEELVNMPYHPIKKKLVNTKFVLGISFSVIAFLLIALLIYRYLMKRRLKKELFNKRIIELENRAIRSQMNPHFVFNALNSIQSLVNQNETEKANLYLSKFALLLRRILKSSENFLVKLSEEIEMISVYCELEQLRTPFNWKIMIDKGVEPEIISIPGMLIQPLVENAILHGFIHKDMGKELTIRFEQKNEELIIKVIDNGVGFNSAKKKDTNGHSLGLNLINEKLGILSKQGHVAKMSINSLEQGTEVFITIAYK